VPFHWDVQTYAALVPLVSHFYLMNYETEQLDRLVERTQRLLSVVPLDALSVALRPKDFASHAQFEYTLDALYQATGVQQFAIHKLRDMFEHKDEQP
jgi:hypothetical protein